MNMKGMNAYQHFGLRQPWIEHFMADGVNCFGQGVLGNRQYDALKVWLRDAGIIESNKDKTISVTSLGEKLIQRGHLFRMLRQFRCSSNTTDKSLNYRQDLPK